MTDLTTKYLGLSLKSPIIAASSGFTDSVHKLKQLEQQGVGAVILKSIFEEEILHEYNHVLKEEASNTGREEFLDYLDIRLRQEKLGKYLELIRQAKNEISIPVIASVNCKSAYEWMSFAEEIQRAGADALELNIFVLPSALNRTSHQNEEIYFEIVKHVKKRISIPVSLKISYYFSNLAQFIHDLDKTGIQGLVLFNRFYSPDFNLDTLEVSQGNVLSQPNEISMPLRWISMLSGRLECDLSASTGVAESSSVIKLLLAGSQTVQVASAFYRHGIGYAGVLHSELRDWMELKGFDSVDAFRGKLSQARYNEPEVFERVQFMKYFSDKEGF